MAPIYLKKDSPFMRFLFPEWESRWGILFAQVTTEIKILSRKRSGKYFIKPKELFQKIKETWNFLPQPVLAEVQQKIMERNSLTEDDCEEIGDVIA